MAVTVEEWLKELQRLATETPADNGFLTTSEMCEQLGKNKRLVIAMLHKAAAAGFLQTTSKRVKRMDGMLTTAPAYKVVTPSKTSRKVR